MGVRGRGNRSRHLPPNVVRRTEDPGWIAEQLALCSPADPTHMNLEANWESCAYFVDSFVRIEDKSTSSWIPFRLWRSREDPVGDRGLSPSQWDALRVLFCHGRVSILKARQLGLTWLCLAIVLWYVVHRPGFMAMMYSLREKEAFKLVKRLKGMYRELPWWMKEGRRVRNDSAGEWEFDDGTTVMGFSTNSGDSYQANVVLMDEATLVPVLQELIGRVRPVVDSVFQGQFWMISRANKEDPDNVFNRIFMSSRKVLEDSGDRVLGWKEWVGVFLPWWLAPYRDAGFYEAERKNAVEVERHTDSLYSMYPNTIEEALSPSTTNKRLPREWVLGVMEEVEMVDAGVGVLSVGREELRVYRLPVVGREYVIGADAAEGLSSSDNSVAVVVDRGSGEECAILCAKYSPQVLAQYIHVLSRWYNGAGVMCERMNHGHAVIMRLEQLGVWLLDGMDDRPGWLSSQQGKIRMYDMAADVLFSWWQGKMEDDRRRERLRESLAEVGVELQDSNARGKHCGMIHTRELALELMSIERLRLVAPDGSHDDRADAWAFAQCGRMMHRPAGIIRADYSMF